MKCALDLCILTYEKECKQRTIRPVQITTCACIQAAYCKQYCDSRRTPLHKLTLLTHMNADPSGRAL
jgi:hypothetical protein